MNTDQANPESKRPEVGNAPFITEDNRLLMQLNAVEGLIRSRNVSARSSVKVSTPNRYVIEIEVISRPAVVAELAKLWPDGSTS